MSNERYQESIDEVYRNYADSHWIPSLDAKPKEEPTMIDDWLNEYGDPEIYKKVERELELREAAEKYSLELLEAKTIQHHEKTWIKWGEAIYKANKKYMPPFKKIILTTDQDLIADGVQAIDDEFLEWFVKNPSCENIPIIMTTVSKESTYKTNIGFESWRKEEPSQDNRMYSEEEVLDILRKSHSIEQTSKMDSWITKWFEQFKKK